MKVISNSISIDGKWMSVKPHHKTVVDVAKDNGIGIPAPCYLQGRKHGCCNGCVILIADEEKYACTIKPKNGLEIIFNTPELKEVRRERFRLYKEALESGEKLECNCGDDCDDDCGCGDGCC